MYKVALLYLKISVLTFCGNICFYQLFPKTTQNLQRDSYESSLTLPCSGNILLFVGFKWSGFNSEKWRDKYKSDFSHDINDVLANADIK